MRLANYFLTYKIFNTFRYLTMYIRDRIRIGNVFYSDGFEALIAKYLNLHLSKDWIGRLYGVINPNIDINGHFDVNNMIIEIDGDATNNIEQVKIWTYRQLSLIGQLFKLQGLYEYIDVEFKHVGPINADNYLVIFDIASRQKFTYFLKKSIIHSILYIAIGISAYVIYANVI